MKEDKIVEKLFRILVHDNEANLDFIVMAKAKSFHHATNLVYANGLVPIREASDNDYHHCYGHKTLTAVAQ